MANPLTGTFGATGQSGEITGQNFYISITGMSSSAVAIEFKDHAGNWVAGESITADTVRQVENLPDATELRLNCTTYGSGTITYMVKGK